MNLLSVENTLPGIGRNALYEPEAMECTFCTNYGAFKKDVLQTFKVTKLRMNIMPFKECAFLWEGSHLAAKRCFNLKICWNVRSQNQKWKKSRATISQLGHFQCRCTLPFSSFKMNFTMYSVYIVVYSFIRFGVVLNLHD